jgi:acrylyl-CoA reductase (NADPH)
MATTYQALFVEESDGAFKRSIVERHTDQLPAGEVLVKVAYSSLNQKDAMSAHGNKGVTRSFPHQPGIDAAGTVVESSVADFKAGDEVVVTGYDLGMNTAGGLGQYIRIPAKWIVKLPQGLTLKQSMQFGTAGLTAQLCINKLEHNGLKKEQGPVLVTGATGGVGSIAIALLAHAGYTVVASSGKTEQADYLKSLGASDVIDRKTLSEENKKPMLKDVYAAAIDVAGGNTLANAIKSIKHSGSVAACGLVENPNFSGSVFPHILRNVNLLGVDSVEIPLADKKAAWTKLAKAASIPALAKLNEEITLDKVIPALEKMHKGGATRHIVVKVS